MRSPYLNRVASAFAQQYEEAHLLSNVDPALARVIVDSGLHDGDLKDDVDHMKPAIVKSVMLTPSQTTMVVGDIVAIALEMLFKNEGVGEDLGAIVSGDGFILDGHHRWAGSILARGPAASVKVWLSTLPGQKLIRVLNLVSKGSYGISSGNVGSGSINDLNPVKVRAQILTFLQQGRKHKYFSMTPSMVEEILREEFGTVEAGIEALSARSKLISKDVPSWAPARDEMPVIQRKNAPAVAQILNQGRVDWNAPYADARMASQVVEGYLRKLG